MFCSVVVIVKEYDKSASIFGFTRVRSVNLGSLFIKLEDSWA
jgi:hypothetical protein